MPFLKGRNDLVGSLLGGWHILRRPGSSRWAPAVHGDPNTAVDLNFDGFSEGRPVILDKSILGNSVDDPDTSTEQLPVTAFRQTTYFDMVDDIVGRNTFFGDGLVNVDLGIYKAFRVYRAGTLSLRVQVFNLFNYVQYGFPTTDIANANSESLTTTGLHSEDGAVQRTVPVLTEKPEGLLSDCQ